MFLHLESPIVLWSENWWRRNPPPDRGSGSAHPSLNTHRSPLKLRQNSARSSKRVVEQRGERNPPGVKSGSPKGRKISEVLGAVVGGGLLSCTITVLPLPSSREWKVVWRLLGGSGRTSGPVAARGSGPPQQKRPTASTAAEVATGASPPSQPRLEREGEEVAAN